MEVTDRIKEQMGSEWAELFRKFIESEKFDNIFRFLKGERAKSRVIIPAKSDDLFRSFKLCPPDKVKCVILLMCPYHTFKEISSAGKKEQKQIANGIPMDCSNTGILQPSLEQWYMAVEDSYFGGMSPDIIMDPSLEYLLDEGIMLVNSSLSVEKDKPNSHKDAWKEFMKEFIDILNLNFRGMPIWLCGAEAQKFESEIIPLTHWILKSEHPAAASYANRNWNYEGNFKKIDQIIRQNNGEEFVPKWYKTKK